MPTFKTHRHRPKALFLAAGLLLATVGCGGGYTALEPGSGMPTLAAAGWTNGEAPQTQGNVVVLEAFATW